MDLVNIEQDLIRACIQRERRAEYELYKITYSYLMSICVRYTKEVDSAKEVLNIGFLRILNNLDKYNVEIPFKAWIRRVMINTLINEYKREKIHYERHLYIEDYNDSEHYTDLNQATTKINADQILELIAKLPPASQQVFNLYCIDGYKHHEIAELLKINEGTSKWHLNSAREKLKAMLNEMNVTAKSFII